MPTRSEGNLKNRTDDISINFDQVINAETDLGISPDTGADPFAFDESQFDGTSTLIQYEPGQYQPTEGSQIPVGTGETIGVESTTQNSADVTFRAATDSASSTILQASDAAGLYVGHLTIDTRANYGSASIQLAGGQLVDGSEIVRDIQCEGWADRTGYKLETVFMDNAEKIVRNVSDTRPIEFGTYPGETTYSLFLGRDATGYAQYDQIELVDIGESGLYSGKDEAEVHLTNSYMENVGYASARVTGSTSSIDNCSFYVDLDNIQADSVDVDADGLIINQVIWTQSSHPPGESSGGGRGGPTIENCDIVVDNAVKSDADGSANQIVSNHPFAGGITLRDTRIENNDARSFQFESINCQTATGEVRADHDPSVTIENVSLTGSFDEGQAIVEIEDRDGSVIRDSCISMPNNADGVESIGVDMTPSHTIEDSTVDVGGTQFITDGANQTTTNISDSGTCTSPDLTSWQDTSSGGGGGTEETQDTFETDFTGYALGSQPSNWTERWPDTAAGDFAPQTVSSPEGNVALQLDVDTNARRALSWDTVGDFQDVEIVGLVRHPVYNQSKGWTRLHARGGTNANDDELGYFAGIGYSDEVGSYELQLADYSATSFDVLDATTIPNRETEWFFIRFRVNGDDLFARAWGLREDEPETWDISATDTTHDSGWVGVGAFSGQVQGWDYVGVGTGGLSAPKPAVSAGRNTIQLTDTGGKRTVDGVIQTLPIVVSPSTGGAANIGTTSADLSLTLSTLEGYYDADVWIEYRESGTSTWTETAKRNAAEGATETWTVSGLTSATEYEYRAVAEGVGEGAEQGTGAINTFTTS